MPEVCVKLLIGLILPVSEKYPDKRRVPRP